MTRADGFPSAFFAERLPRGRSAKTHTIRLPDLMRFGK